VANKRAQSVPTLRSMGASRLRRDLIAPVIRYPEENLNPGGQIFPRLLASSGPTLTIRLGPGNFPEFR
jgi:hypothetical protein